MRVKLSIEQLRTVAGLAIQSIDCRPADSGRVRTTPDVRAIRYYTTLGLIDRPAEMVGRTAYYNQKHVLQLVAIKQLQAKSFSLADIQQKLTGVTNRQLAQIAALPDDFWPSALGQLNQSENGAQVERESISQTTNEQSRCEAFWAQPVALPSKPITRTGTPLRNDVEPPGWKQNDGGNIAKSHAGDTTRSVGVTIPINEAIQLIIQASPNQLQSILSGLNEDQLHQLQSAAQPLIEELKRQKLI